MNHSSTIIARTGFAGLALLILALPGRSQAINIDLATGSGVPSIAYGGAAGQAGIWNGVHVSASPVALKDTADNATAVTLDGTAGHFGLKFDNPATLGDDEALMDDLLDGDGTYTISGLASGDYDIYTYAWAPDSATYASSVSVSGSPDPSQIVGGAWPGAHVSGITFTKHHVTVTGGPVTIFVSTSTVFASCNGFQIVPAAPVCPPPTTFCTAKVNSCGHTPVLNWTGTPSATATNSFVIEASNARMFKTGILIYTDAGRRIPAATFGQGGLLCLNPPVRRSRGVHSAGGTGGAACDASFSIDVTAFATGALGGNPQPYLSIPGTVVDCQVWGRDSLANGDYLSGGLEFVVCP